MMLTPFERHDARRPATLLKLARRAGLALLAVVAWSSAPPAAHASESGQHRLLPFEISWGEFTIVEGALSISDAEASYALSGKASTRGPLDIVAPWSGAFEAAGAKVDGGRTPEMFRGRSESRRGVREAMVRYGEDGVDVEITPPDERERTPVDLAETRDATDVMTYFAKVFDSVAASEGRDCSTIGRVWDGVRLMEITTATLGEGVAPGDRPWSYEGPTLRCQLFFQRLGGFPVERSRRWSTEEDEVERIIHFAEVDGQWTPVRVEVSAPLGAVIARFRVRPDEG